MKPYWEDGQITLYHGDCLDVLPSMPSESIDSIVCDPPYGLTELSLTVVLQAIAAWMAGDRTHVPDGRGFMGKEWDKFVPPPGVWDECLRVLKPGGHLLAFAGTRAMDLMTLSIRIAGFEIRDAVADLTGIDGPGLLWCYGQGMPKSLNVSKAIDKAAGAEREVIGKGVNYDAKVKHGGTWTGSVYAQDSYTGAEGPLLTAPATEDAARWDGWGTGLKPSWEPIVVARKPLGGTVVANVLKHGTGAVNVKACQVEASGRPLRIGHGEDSPGKATYGSGGPGGGSHAAGTTDTGRWPPNLVLAHSPQCVQVGERQIPGDSRAGQEPGTRPGGFGDVGAEPGDARPNGTLHGPQVVPVFDCTPGCPVAEMDRQSGVRKSGDAPRVRNSAVFRDTYGEFAGQRECPPGREANEGGSSRFFPVFRYNAKASQAERPRLGDGTAWPTVKPPGLVRWLARLVTPPGGTILDPFAGTGPLAEAAIIEGFNCILIDKDPVAVALIQERLSKDIQPDLFGGAA